MQCVTTQNIERNEVLQLFYLLLFFFSFFSSFFFFIAKGRIEQSEGYKSHRFHIRFRNRFTAGLFGVERKCDIPSTVLKTRLLTIAFSLTLGSRRKKKSIKQATVRISPAVTPNSALYNRSC